MEGQTFCLSTTSGDILHDHPHGLFVLDTRVLSRWELRVNGRVLEPLGVDVPDPFVATFVSRTTLPSGRVEPDIAVFRRRHIGRGMRERITITNHGLDAARLQVTLRCDVDFADLFAVKENRVEPIGHRGHEVGDNELRFLHYRDLLHRNDDGEPDRSATLRLGGDVDLAPFRATWRPVLEPGESWEVCIELEVSLAGTPIAPRFRCNGDTDDAQTVPVQRLASWRATLPVVETDARDLKQALDRSGEDLGALRIFDPERPELAILAAGAPWFMTVFGRDSLLTAWMTLIADPSLALGVLEILARYQGEDVVARTEEEPGKILHEMRFAGATGLALGGADVYYGSIDATPLFVMLLGELRRWDLEDAAVKRLLPHADRALEWIEKFGDRDGDGYVEYQRRTPTGLANQGWKDSWDAVRFADGRLAEPPIALCEVQAYVYAAYVARSHFAREEGDFETMKRYAVKAAELRRRFNEDFWLDDVGAFAMALDRDKRPVDAIASNMGHCLWTGIVDLERAPAIARHLLSPDMFSGWGVRTLSKAMRAFNPVSYHNGSVWPHDNAICAAGLVRYGFVEEAHRIVEGQLAAAAASGGRLPELFAGFERSVLGVPAAYPTSCSPQAWAAASPLMWLRTLLRLDPWAPKNQVLLAPELPPWIRYLDVDGIRICDHSLRVTVYEGRFEVHGAEGLEVVHKPREPLTSALPGSP
ncbi:MAG TPA: glycogen debranching N-terminal domain-containing protein [Acidimicrobiales bacterium]